MRGHHWFAAALALVLAARADAETATQPICADRPGKSTATCTAPAGHFQIETSFADWTLSEGGGQRDTFLAIGETTIKYGLTDRSDIEIDVTPWVRGTSRGGGVHDSSSGFGDLGIIYKHRLTPDDSALQITAYPFIKIPTAKRPLGNRKLEGGFILPIQYSIPKSPLTITLGPELDWAADGDGHGHHAAMAQVASLGWQLTSRLSVSGEVWGEWDWGPAGTTRQASVDVSAAYLARNDLQLDAGANFGLNRMTPDLEIYAGIARQF